MSDKRFVRNGSVGLLQSIAPVVQTGDGTVTGTYFDRQAYPEDFADALVVASFGALGGGGTVSSTVTVEESDASGSGYTQVTDENLIDESSMVFTAAGIAYRSIRLNKLKRYVRAKAVVDFTAGSSPSQPLSVEIIGINPRWNPSEDN